MDLDAHLEHATVLDCQGRERYRLTLLLDGRVRVRFLSGIEAVVDPGKRVCHTPGVTVPEDLWPEIQAMSPARR